MSPIFDAWRSSSATILTESSWCCAEVVTLATVAWTSELSCADSACMPSAVPRPSVATFSCRVIAPLTWFNAASDSCAAPAASSAPVAICIAARFSSSAADAASLIPADSSPLALATRSEACCCLASVRARLRCASASRVTFFGMLPAMGLAAIGTSLSNVALRTRDMRVLR